MQPDEQNNNPTDTSGVNTEQMFQPSYKPPQPNSPVPNTAPPGTSGPGNSPYRSSGGQRKKILIIIGVAVAVLITVVIIAVVLSGSSKKNNQQNNTKNVESTGIVKEPQAVDIEGVSNSINSDMAGLDDGKDFPEDNLSDKSLGL